MNNRRVLIIEDDQDDAEFIILELNKLKTEFDVQVIETEEQLHEAFEKNRPDIVVSDYNIPSFNGLEAFEIVKEYDPDLPFILCSGYIGEEEAVNAIKLGVADYVLKDRLIRLGPSVQRELTNADIKKQQKKDELRYQRLIRDLPGAIYTCDAQGRVIHFNKAAARLWGREPEVGKDLWCGSWKIYQVDGSPLPLDSCPMALAMKEGKPISGAEIMIEQPNGEIRYVLAYPTPETNPAGQTTGAVNMLIDVTDQKLAEQEKVVVLRNLKERIKEQSCLYTITKLNEQNLSIEELLDQAVQIIPKGFQRPDYIAARIVFNEHSCQTPKYQDTNRALTVQYESRKGSQLQISIASLEQNMPADENPILKEESQLLNSIATNLLLIIDQKQREIEQEALHRHNELLLESTAEGLYGIDVDGNCTFINKAATQMLGYEREECLGKNMHQLIHYKKSNGEIYPEAECPIFISKNAFTGYQIDTELFWKSDGSGFEVEYSSLPIIDEGVIKGAVITFKDISNRKQIEERLKFQAHLLNEIGEAIMATDLDGNITYWNRTAEKLYGWTSEEVTGRNVLDITPSSMSKQQADEIMAVLKRGKNWSGEFMVQRKDGSTFPALVTDSSVLNGNGELAGIIGISKDITKQKQNEEVISNSLKEKEILLAEIHHRVKNNLAVVSAMLELQAGAEENASIAGRLLDSVTRIRTIANIHEHLYQSKTFSKLDFAENLRQLATNIVDTLHIHTDVKLKFTCDPVQLNINQAIPCSLIVNEVITNILKHAFPGKKCGLIHISLDEKADKLKLTVKDDGKRFNGNLKDLQSDSLGLQIIEVLSQQLKANYNFSATAKFNFFAIEFVKADVKGSGSNLIQ